MSPVNSMFVCIKKKKKILSANLFLKWPISIIGKMLNIGADNRSTPNLNAYLSLHLCSNKLDKCSKTFLNLFYIFNTWSVY